MACPVKYIEDRYREKYPKLADRLTDVFYEVWSKMADSNLFRGKNNSLLFSGANTKQNAKQMDFLKQINNQYGAEIVSPKPSKFKIEHFVSINVIPLEKSVYNKMMQPELFDQTIKNIKQDDIINEEDYLNSLPDDNFERDIDYFNGDEALMDQDNDKQFQKSTFINENLKESEFGIRDLAARLAARIGGTVSFESDLTKDYAGYNEGNNSIINLAKATLDTPIHEIVGHPIIKVIRNGSTFITEETITETQADNIIRKNQIVEKNGIRYQAAYDTPDGTILYRHDKTTKTEPNTALYQNLLIELESGYGKEVLDRVKNEYLYKDNNPDLEVKEYVRGHSTPSQYYVTSKTLQFNSSPMFNTEEEAKKWLLKNSVNKYTLEEQQEESLVQLLGELTAGKLKETKENKGLISLLKKLLSEMTAYMRSLFNSKEIEIDKLKANMTLNDLSDLLAYTNSKIILPGNSVEYTTPDNSKFSTYQEASNHVSTLFKGSKEVDLSKTTINREITEKEKDQIKKYENDKIVLLEQLKDLKSIREDFLYQEPYVRIKDFDYGRIQNTESPARKGHHTDQLPKDYSGYYVFGYTVGKDEKYIKPISKEDAKKVWEEQGSEVSPQTRQNVYRKESEIEQIDYKINQLRNNPITAFIEKNKEFEQSKEIIDTWKKENNIQYNPEEVYSRGQGFYSAIGAYSTLELDLLLQNLLQHIEDNKKAGGAFEISAFTKPINKKLNHLEKESSVRFVMYPKSEDIKWAAPTDVYSGSVWDAGEKVSKDKKSELLGVSHTKAPSLQNINQISPNLASIIDERSHFHNELGIELTTSNFRLEFDDTVPYEIKKLVNTVNNILDQKYGKVSKPEIRQAEINDTILNNIYEIEGKYFYNDNTNNEVELSKQQYEKLKKQNYISVQPTQTRENTRSIESFLYNDTPELFMVKGGKNDYWYYKENDQWFVKYVPKGEGVSYVVSNENLYSIPKHTADENYRNNEDGTKKDFSKEYTSQALINTKIAKLKEIAKSQPRSLITSKVVNNQSTERQYQKSSTQINYTLKSIEILSSDKAKELFKKGEKNRWNLNKILSELQVPKQEKQLILDSGKTNIDDIIIDLLANSTYTIEMNVARVAKGSIDEGFERIDGRNEEETTATYSNLTVPGGTNYIEVEFATPAIIPSIQSHAAFKTENGIGWARMDDKRLDIIKGNWVEDENEIPNEFSYLDFNFSKKTGEWKVNDSIEEDIRIILYNYNLSIGNSIEKNKPEFKTKRILEVQSDLFQKGRDKKDLVSNNQDFKSGETPIWEITDNRIEKATEEEYLEAMPYNKGIKLSIEPFSIKNSGRTKFYELNGYFYFEGRALSKYKVAKSNLLLEEIDKSPNKFLQLLNKENNWVTFFIKSIIQDSAKKGYEKVLFPSGDTASKVEGHTTLEEFKKQKEDRIKELEEEIDFIKEEHYEGLANDMSGINKRNIEINQLKQELQRVEGPEGFGALKPIYNFYENTVTNILNKNYGKENVKRITDEYGNTWNELIIDPRIDMDAIFIGGGVTRDYSSFRQSLYSIDTNPELLNKGDELIDEYGENCKL